MDTIKIQIDTNAEQASKSFEDLSKSFKNTDAQAEDLRKQIRGLKDELFTLTPGTEEYSACLEELGAKMNQLGDTTQELRAATGGLDTVFQTTTNATASMAAGFTAVTGVISLFGGDAEDLQKTFVKLQALMSIMNGLKGFAGFGKVTKQASISLKTFVSQTLLANKAIKQEATSTTQLSAAQRTANNSTSLLTGGFKKLTAAISSNPIGALLTVVATLATAFTLLGDKISKATSYLQIFGDEQAKGSVTSRTYSEQLSIQEQKLEDYYSMLKTIGVSEEEIHEQRIADKKKELEDLEKQKAEQEQIKKNAEEYGTWEYKLITWFFPSLNPKLEQAKEQLKELDGLINDVTDDIDVLGSKPMPPDSWSNLQSNLTELGNIFKVKIAGGLADQGDYLRAQIKVYQDAYNDLYEIVGGGGTHPSRKIKGATEKEISENKRLSTIYKAQLASLQVELDAYNAGVEKKNRDAAQKLADELEKNYDQLINNVTNEAKDIVNKWNTVLESLDFNTFTLLPEEERSGRLSAQTMRFEADIDNYLNTWRELAKKAKISEDQMKEFNASLDNIKQDLIDNLNIKFDTKNISDDVRKIGESIQNSISDIKLDNENMLKALSAGLISKEDYQEWVVKAMQEYKTITDQAVETNNPFEEAFINASKAIIPPEVQTQMQSEVKAYYDNIVKEIDKGFKEMEDSYKKESDKFAHDILMETTAWMHGENGELKSGNSLVMNLLFGAGENPTSAYNKAREQAQKIFDAVKQETEAEVQYLKDKMALLEEGSEAYKAYEKQIEEVYANLAKAQEEFESDQLNAADDYANKLYGMVNDSISAVSGLASAMGSYYAEQAEQARDANGELTEESKKYLEKEGRMKIAQVWSDAAMGIMAAWAANAKYGVASYVLAGIQTAALLATAVASTRQIQRETQAKTSGSAASANTAANVGQLTDRVIMAEAQNTDQTAQLNAEYSAGNQRVYVTQSDITDAQDTNRVAVTNNRF